jgi:hypothetical protein
MIKARSPYKEGVPMIIGICGHCLRPGLHSAVQYQRRRLYTPSMNSYQRFERAMVGLGTGAREGRQEGRVRMYKRRQKT